MILSDRDIKEMIASGELYISPLEDNQIQPASVDIRLSNCFAEMLKPYNGVINMSEETRYVQKVTNSYLLEPGKFVLASTREYIKVPSNVTAFVEGRSSIGRLGLFIQNAGWVDPGFEGEITLELFNAGQYPIELIPNKRVGQLVFAKTKTPALNPYKGKYQGQTGAVGSKLYMDLLQAGKEFIE